ncbi:MAG: SpoIIE family protein phosphatase [Actinomycetota bacterium]|nr:SpoIIE family protein phosphatase [Actinomycetota bacterium]
MAQAPPARVAKGARSASAIVAEAAEAIHAERDLGRLLGWVATAACELTGAEASAVCLFPRDEEPVWALDGSLDLSALGDLRRHAVLRPACQGDDAVRLRHPADHPSAAGVASCLPDVNALLAVPVLRTDRTPHGVLLLATRAGDAFAEDVEAHVRMLAAHLGVALDNHARFHALQQARMVQRELVERLQEAVRTPTPEVTDTELGVFYLPADPGAPTGGDLYDWLVLPDGTLHVAIVDVMGKGVAATKDALAITHALRLLVLDGCPLVDVVARADLIVTAQSPDLVATLVVAHYDPDSGELRLAGAGHPPVLLVRDGRAEELKSPGIPIGWPGAGSDDVHSVFLGRSDTVVFYTDGLIEAGKDILTGLDALARFAEETCTYPGAQQARVLVERALTGAARRDDSLALVLRRRSPPTAGVVPLGRFEHRLSPSPATVPLGRNLLREWLVRVPVEADAVHDLLLVATELCANAVEHASWTDGGVALRAWCEGTDIVIEVEDDGGGLSWPTVDDEPPDPEAEQGRGLWLVHTLTDEVVPEMVGTHTVVRARIRNVSPPPR